MYAPRFLAPVVHLRGMAVFSKAAFSASDQAAEWNNEDQKVNAKCCDSTANSTNKLKIFT